VEKPADGSQRFVELWMPASIQGRGQWVPKEGKHVAEVVFGRMVPGCRQTVRFRGKERPDRLPDRRLSENGQAPAKVDAALLSQLARAGLKDGFARLYSAFDELVSGKRVAKGQQVHTIRAAAEQHGADFPRHTHPNLRVS
jgi:hypothetical protein